jgi:hypothetical protein
MTLADQMEAKKQIPSLTALQIQVEVPDCTFLIEITYLGYSRSQNVLL